MLIAKYIYFYTYCFYLKIKYLQKYKGGVNMIGIDIGRNQVKAYSQDFRVKFPSRVGEWRQRRLNSGGDYELEYNGKKYFIGDLAEESYTVREMATESKLHDETKLLFITVLALYSKDTNITIGLPVSQHVAENKQRFISMLQGRHVIGLNNAPGSVYNVLGIGVVPESAGVFWNEVLNNRGEVINDIKDHIRIIDIGSHTINYCTIRDRKYIDKDSGTLNYGIYELENTDQKEQFTRKIVADLSKVWLKQYPVLIAGGGGLLLFDYLKNHFDCRLVDDPIFANVKGFYKMGVATCGK